MIKQQRWWLMMISIVLGIGLAYAGNSGSDSKDKGGNKSLSSNPNTQAYQKMLDQAAADGQAQIAQYYTAPPSIAAPPAGKTAQATGTANTDTTSSPAGTGNTTAVPKLTLEPAPPSNNTSTNSNPAAGNTNASGTFNPYLPSQ